MIPQKNRLYDRYVLISVWSIKYSYWQHETIAEMLNNAYGDEVANSIIFLRYSQRHDCMQKSCKSFFP